MSFESSPAFFLLILLAVVVIYYLRVARQKKASLQFSSTSLFSGVSRGWRSRFGELPFLLKVLAGIFLIIALARPREANTKVKKNVEGIDIMFALDISDSMLIEDMTPENRMEAAKQTIRDFIKGRISDRMGLVVFSGESYTRVPLTLDYGVLLDSLSKVETTRGLKMGTAIGVSLANAVARLKESRAKSRVVILLTDGENNAGTIAPETALEIAKGFGIKIYTIGIGQDGPTRLPVYTQDPFGRTVKTYQPFTSTVNETLLEKMASDTGGKYYRASKTQSLKNVFSEIDRLEKTKIDVNRYTKYKEQFMYYLLIAFWLYIASYLFERTVLRRLP